MRFGRRYDGPVSQIAVDGRAFLHHPEDGALEVRQGCISEGTVVYATVSEPRRWFVVRSGVSAPQGVWAMILWEVAATTGQRELKRYLSGRAKRLPVIDVLTEVAISNEGEWMW